MPTATRVERGGDPNDELWLFEDNGFRFDFIMPGAFVIKHDPTRGDGPNDKSILIFGAYDDKNRQKQLSPNEFREFMRTLWDN